MGFQGCFLSLERRLIQEVGGCFQATRRRRFRAALPFLGSLRRDCSGCSSDDVLARAQHPELWRVRRADGWVAPRRPSPAISASLGQLKVPLARRALPGLHMPIGLCTGLFTARPWVGTPPGACV